MGNIVKIPEEAEPEAFFCETCAKWDVLNGSFFIYDDGTIRCTECGNAWSFEEDDESVEY